MPCIKHYAKQILFPVFVILPLCFGCEDTDQLPFPIDEVGCDKFINQLIKPGSKSQDSVDIVQDMGFDCRTETEKRVIYCKRQEGTMLVKRHWIVLFYFEGKFVTEVSTNTGLTSL